MSKKEQVLTKLYRVCQKQNDYVFHNKLVKEICVEVGFGNPFDVTKLDNKSKLPTILVENDYALIHLGSGYHQFIKGINNIYHDFEVINKTVNWNYQRSLLSHYNSRESNLLSVANNQRILHDFLFGQDTEFDNLPIIERPKTYFPHRTKTSFNYAIGKNVNVELKNIQIEIGLTFEFKGQIDVLEAKNGKPNNFAIYQIYHPFLYYYQAQKTPNLQGNIKDISCVYIIREKQVNIDMLKLWAYTFTKPYDMTSIKHIKSKSYRLINQDN